MLDGQGQVAAQSFFETVFYRFYIRFDEYPYRAVGKQGDMLFFGNDVNHIIARNGVCKLRHERFFRLALRLRQAQIVLAGHSFRADDFLYLGRERGFAAAIFSDYGYDHCLLLL